MRRVIPAHCLVLGLFLCFARLAPATVAAGDAFWLVERNGGAVTSVWADESDFPVVHHAARLLAEDVERVTGRKPAIERAPTSLAGRAVLVGTLGKSRLIDQLVADGRLDVEGVAGEWESFAIQVVTGPLPGFPKVEEALIIAGSDRRGTAYGVFTVSEEIGVSPWYWWADVTPDPQESLSVTAEARKQGPPDVKYRGIFINDEDWGLEPWSRLTFDPKLGDIGPKTYEKVYELLLRLRGNYLWPGMHNCTIEFGSVPGNVEKADEWAIVMGAAHCEPLNRNNVWWHQDGEGEWRYDTNRENMLAYWEEWAQKRGPYEAVWTVGMRGIHDSGMRGPETIEEQVRLLEQAIDDQRELLKRHVHDDIEQVPQVFTPYKEALTHYQNGLELPEDVTILWCEDNYGYIRQLSNPEEQQRSGGSGVYYHISYLGWPRPYLWLNTTPPALMWAEMTRASAYGADRVWVLNVGDIKPGEIGIEFWHRLAWDVDRYGPDAQQAFLREWAAREFGPEHAEDVAGVVDNYYQLGFQRKPELMADDIFNAAHYREGERRLAASRELRRRADELYGQVPSHKRDAFYQLVVYPVRILALIDEAFISADLGRLYAMQGRAGASQLAEAAGEAVRQAETETRYYNEQLAGGKWRHMMTVKGIGGDWNIQWPSTSSHKPVSGPAMGVVIEGKGLPLLGPAGRARVESAQIDLPAASASHEAPMTLSRGEDGVEYLVVPNRQPLKSGNTLEPGTGAKASFEFEVTEGGLYNLFALINAPTIEDDSWFVKMDLGPWKPWNDNATRGWEWRRQGTYDLRPGRHTITIANREDGAMLSAIRLTPRQTASTLAEIHAADAPADWLGTFRRGGAEGRGIEIYNLGAEPFAFEATASEPWIKLSQSGGTVEDQVRLSVEVDWDQAPRGAAIPGMVVIRGAGEEQVLRLELANQEAEDGPAAGSFAERDGYISIEAEDATSRRPAEGGAAWTTITSLGRTGDAVTVLPPTFGIEPDPASIAAAPALEYEIYLAAAPEDGEVVISTYCLPTHRVHEGRGLRYAIAIDDEPPQIVDFYEDGGHGGEQSPRWRENVARNAAITVTRHELTAAGRHTLRIWAVDPGVVLDKIVIDTGGLQASYLGPPETRVPEAE